jgi:dTDP-4-amino-4,6-dideoxygalactose transaminase
MNVPFLDLGVQYQSIKEEINQALHEVINKTAFAGGPFVAQFEEEFASFCGTRYAIGVGSGTDALWLSLLALGIGKGDEVITVPNTFIATAEAITYAGATPVFVDVVDGTYNMDSSLLKGAITPRTKAIMPVHLFGQTADMDPIMAIAAESGLYVIEDACQAHGAGYKGKRAGSIGHTGCFSFYPGKNLGAYGEAGAVVTDRQDLADRIRMLRDHGQPKKYYHNMIGWNARMDGFQGAVLSVKLKRLEVWNEGRRNNAGRYNDTLRGIEGVILPLEADYGRHVYHIYAVRVENRDDLIDALAKKGIATGIHYPIPLHLQDAYRSLGYKRGDFPVVEQSASQFVSLPMFPELTDEGIGFVAKAIKEFL